MSQAITWAIGKTILDDYVIERELGRGGMGCVWLVKSKSTGRLFAVKQTLIKDDQHRKAFLTELQTWIDLPEHPNIVPCRFFRTVGDEIVIFADYIAGGSLAEWIARRKLTKLEQILDVAIQFAWGLHAVHERGLIHQDVKPGNVLMTPDGVPLVTDFGLARARLRASDGQFVSPVANQGRESVLISAGGMTPAYASPEQWAGQPLSRKTDIWSWGVSVLDMFMGGVSCPHGGQTAAAVLEGFLESRQMEDDLPEMPGDVADILRKCFARDPAARWSNLNESVRAMIDVVLRATGRKYDRKLHHTAELQREGIQHDRRFANANWYNPRELLRAANAAVGRDPNEADIYQPPPAYSLKGAGVADLAIYEEAERLFLRASGSDHIYISVSLARLNMNKALLCFSLDDAPGALRAYDKCISILWRLVEQEGRRELADDLAGALINKANAIRFMRDLVGAITLYDQCIAMLQRHLVEQEDQWGLVHKLAVALMNKGIAIYSLGDQDRAVNLFDQCITIYKRLSEQEGRWELADDLATALINKANSISSMGDRAGAVALYDQCIVIYKRLVERDGRWELANNLAMALMNKANQIYSIGDRAGAVSLYDQCIAIYTRLVEQEGRRELANNLATVLINKGVVIENAGDSVGAVALYDQGIAIYKRLVEQEGRRDLTNALEKARLQRWAAD